MGCMTSERSPSDDLAHRHEQDANISYVTAQSPWLALCPLPTSPGIKKTVGGQAHAQTQCQGRCGLRLEIFS